MADWARTKWYIRLASRFIRAMELKMMTAPCRRSALWKDVRLEGIDFVLRCRAPPTTEDRIFLGAEREGAALALAAEFSRRRPSWTSGARPILAAVPLPS